MEGELHQRFVAAERATLAQELERLDVDRPEVSIEGRRHRRVLRATETYTSGVGPITVLRTLYRAGKEQPAVVPLELRAGIISGHSTPRAAHQASFLVAQVTPREGAEMLDGLGNMSPSASPVRGDGRRARRAVQRAQADALFGEDRPQPPPDEFTDGYVQELPMPTSSHQAILALLSWPQCSLTRIAGSTLTLASIRSQSRARRSAS